MSDGEAIDFAAPILCSKLYPKGPCRGEIVSLSKEQSMKGLRQARKKAAERDGQLESVRAFDGIDSVSTCARVLVCKDLEQGADPAALRSYFNMYGTIADLKVIPVGKTGLSEAHILYDTSDAVDAVLAPENLDSLPCRAERMVVKGKVKVSKEKELEVYGNACITVLNMPCRIEKYLLEEYFGEFGPILYIDIPEPFKGSCDIYYTSDEFVEGALLVTQHSVDGIPVKVVAKADAASNGQTLTGALAPDPGELDTEINTSHVWKAAQSGSTRFEADDDELAAGLAASKRHERQCRDQVSIVVEHASCVKGKFVAR